MLHPSLKVVRVTVELAQAQRLRCAACHVPHTVLAVEPFTGTALSVGFCGLHLFREASLRDAAERRARGSIRRALHRRRGEGRCPSCQRLQPWMLGRRLLALWPCVGLIAILLAVVCAAGAAIVGAPPAATMTAVVALTALWTRHLVRVEQEEAAREVPLERAVRDAELRDLFDRVERTGADLPLRWALRLQLGDARTRLVSGGFVDRVGDALPPARLDPLACFERSVASPPAR